MSDLLRNQNLMKDLKEWLPDIKDLKDLSASRSFAAFRKDAGLYCGSRLLEGRSVCLCWAKSKPKGPKGPEMYRGFLRKVPVTGYGGIGSSLKVLKVKPHRSANFQSRFENPKA